MIHYTDDLTSIRENMLYGFFVGWPQRPSPGQHLAVLRRSYRSVLAIDDADERVVGFVNMLSDGVLTAFIPWLEVLPGYQGRGIGGELMRRILDGMTLEILVNRQRLLVRAVGHNQRVVTLQFCTGR